MKKSGFNGWSYNMYCRRCSSHRDLKLIQCLLSTSNVLCLVLRVSSIQSCFGHVLVLVNLNRAGIEAISPNNVYMLCFGIISVYSMSLCVKTIVGSRLSMIRALIGGPDL